MKKCKSGGCPISGEEICCKGCDKLQTCESACEDALDLTTVCPDEVDEPEETLPEKFKKNQAAAIQAITDILKTKKELEEKEKTIREKLVAAMEEHGIKKFSSEWLDVTYIAPTTRTSVDGAKLKKEKPNVYAAYSKTSNVSASVKISLKGD